MAPKPLKVIETNDDSSLTDDQVKALKDLTPEEIRILKLVAESSRTFQVIISIIVGIAATVAFVNSHSIKEFISKVLQ